MTGLLRAEVRRLTSRRLFRVLGLIFLGVLLLVQVVSAARSREPTAFERAQIDQSLVECQLNSPDPDDCEDIVGFYDPQYRAADQLPEVVGAVAVGGMLMAFVMGASFAGAEWAAGTMQALLFWEPRRERVVAAKALALAGVLVAFVAVMEAVGIGLTFLVGSTRGTTEGLTSGIVQSALLTGLRGLVVVTFTGLLGFAVAGLARVTGAALGAAFVYFAILEQVIGGLRPGWIRYLIAPNVVAVLTNDIEVPARRSTELDMTDPVITLTAGRGMLTLAVYLALVLGAFYLVFSRRDVT